MLNRREKRRCQEVEVDSVLPKRQCIRIEKNVVDIRRSPQNCPGHFSSFPKHLLENYERLYRSLEDTKSRQTRRYLWWGFISFIPVSVDAFPGIVWSVDIYSQQEFVFWHWSTISFFVNWIYCGPKARKRTLCVLFREEEVICETDLYVLANPYDVSLSWERAASCSSTP